MDPNEQNAVVKSWDICFPFFTKEALNRFGPDKMQRIMDAMNRKEGTHFVFQIFKKTIDYHTPFNFPVNTVIHTFKNTKKNEGCMAPTEFMDIDAHERFVSFLQETDGSDEDDVIQEKFESYQEDYHKQTDDEKYGGVGSDFADGRLKQQLFKKGYFRLERTEGESVLLSKKSGSEDQATYLFPPGQCFTLLVWFILYFDYAGESVSLLELKTNFEGRYRFWSSLFGVFVGTGWWNTRCEKVKIKAWVSTDPGFPAKQRLGSFLNKYSTMDMLDADRAREMALLYFLASPPITAIAGQQSIPSPLSSAGSVDENKDDNGDGIRRRFIQLDFSDDED